MSDRSEWHEAFNGICNDIFAGDCAMKSKGKSFILNNPEPYILGRVSIDATSLPAGSKYELDWWKLSVSNAEMGPPPVQKCVKYFVPGMKLVVFLLAKEAYSGDPKSEVVDYRLMLPVELQHTSLVSEIDRPDAIIWINWNDFIKHE